MRIYRNRNGVAIQIGTDLPHENDGVTLFNFSLNCPDIQYAELLKRYIDDRLRKAIVKTRREEYERGWRDARAKIKKQTDFNEALNF